MRKLFAVAALIFILGPLPAAADPTPMPLDQIGVGPKGYDFMLGFWKCAGTRYYSPGVTFNDYIHITRSHLSGSIALDWEYGDQDVESWSYDAKSKTWSSSDVKDETSDQRNFNGGPTLLVPLYNESTTDTGPKSVWTGSRSAQFRHTPIRDTWTFTSLSELDDLTEIKVKDSWTTFGDDHCVKST